MSADAMIAVDAARFELVPALAEFDKCGYARLGRIVTEEALSALGERVDELMSERVRHEGLFFQRDSPTGRYEDLAFGEGWQGPSSDYRKIEKLELDPLFRALIGNPLHERIARALIARTGRALPGGPLHQERARRHGAAVAPGRWTRSGASRPRLSCRSGRRSTTASIDSGCVEVFPVAISTGLRRRRAA